MTELLARTYINNVLINAVHGAAKSENGIELLEHLAEALRDQVASLPDHIAYINAVEAIGLKIAFKNVTKEDHVQFGEIRDAFLGESPKNELTARRLISLVTAEQMDRIKSGATLDRFNALIDVLEHEGFLPDHSKYFASVRALAEQVQKSVSGDIKDEQVSPTP